MSKTNILIVTVLIIFLVLFIGILSYLVIADKIHFNKNKVEPTGTFTLKAIDEITGDPIYEGYYIISKLLEDYEQIYESGNLSKDSWTAINYYNQYLTKLYVNAKGYYASNIYISPSIEKDMTFKAELSPQCKPTIEHIGELKEGDSQINLTINCWNGSIRKMSLCFSWSLGVIDIKTPLSNDYCEYGNWSKTNYQNKSIKYQENIYGCGERDQWCNKVDGRDCRLRTMSIPRRLFGDVDHCVYLGRSLNNGNYSLPLFIKTLFLRNDDNIEVYLLDMEKIYMGDELHLVTEDENQNDIGIKDTIYKIE